MKFVLVLIIVFFLTNCISPKEHLINKSFKDEYPIISTYSSTSKLEKSRHKALKCYFDNNEKDNFIYIEIERYPNGNFDKMRYLSYYKTFGNEIYSCNDDHRRRIIDDSREKTISEIVKLVKEKKFNEIKELSRNNKNFISDAGTIYITVCEKNIITKVFKTEEFFIDDKPIIPEGFK